MTENSLATLVEQYPQTAEKVFDRLDTALNEVLPGSDTHERYAGIEEVGLAMVVGRDAAGVSYNPLMPATRERLSFIRDNQEDRPNAWQPKAIDEEIIGGVLPEAMGRFTVYALAKINGLTTNDRLSSFLPEKLSVAPGIIGLAGGQRTRKSLLGVSGLWEVHDHLVGSIYKNEFIRATVGGRRVHTAHRLARDIESKLAAVKALHPDVPADQLGRNDIARLLPMIDKRIVK